MILTAENGWSFGEWGYGEDKKAELQRAMDEHRAEMGLEPVDWSESAEPQATGGAADKSSSARDACPDRPARRRASSEPSSSDGGGEFTSPKLTSSARYKPRPRVRRV
jgi:hypothetical protein